jgi:hypothetical protein
MDLFKDTFKSLTEKHEHLLDTNPENEKIYAGQAYVINKTLSLEPHTLVYSNIINTYYNLDPRLQYDFYFYGIKRKRIFNPWPKKDAASNNLEIIKEYYNYNDRKAKEVMKILSNDQIKELKRKLYKGD